MATIQKRGDSYLIRVSCGYDSKGKQVIQSKTWKPEPTMTERQVEKELNCQAVMFEGTYSKDYQSKAIKFEIFAEQWFEEYARPNLRNTTDKRMLQLRKRVYAAIGHLQMDKITPRQIQANEQTEKKIYTPEQVQKFLTLLNDEPLKYRTFFNLMIYSGFRRGEMLKS